MFGINDMFTERHWMLTMETVVRAVTLGYSHWMRLVFPSVAFDKWTFIQLAVRGAEDNVCCAYISVCVCVCVYCSSALSCPYLCFYSRVIFTVCRRSDVLSAHGIYLQEMFTVKTTGCRYLMKNSDEAKQFNWYSLAEILSEHEKQLAYDHGNDRTGRNKFHYQIIVEECATLLILYVIDALYRRSTKLIWNRVHFGQNFLLSAVWTLSRTGLAYP